ncbi:MauE/DoxX family redox-associated membrane protein [Actinomadura macra]|uniref:MauE/DoxX family redox-associated membrane protein n=1 Tax=Actinomadura macra TaxID=46164 RepID=UPI00083067B2|nr:MauE/DoxX family redox-associated membrane protein [Actinomadura macra]
MTALLAGIAAVAVPLVLLGSAFGQLRRPRTLPAALRAQGVLPASLAVPAAVIVVAAEGMAGASAAIALLLWLDGAFRAASAASALLLAAYALYGTSIVRWRKGAPCGCAGDAASPMTGWVAGRAAALAALALAGAVHGLPGGTSGSEMSVIVTAGLGFTVILWTLPHAMIERSTAG